MKSIRLSLVFYFLLLEAAALGVVSWLAYRAVGQSQVAEQESGRKLLLAHHDDQVHEEKQRFDEELLRQAKKIANLAKSQIQRGRASLAPYMSLGLLTSSVDPHGHLLAPLWAAYSLNGPMSRPLMSRLSNTITVSEELLPRDAELSDEEYFQINSEWKSDWKSRNLDNWLPFEPSLLSASPLGDWSFDDVELPNGVIGRRVLFKTTITNIWFANTIGFIPPPPNNSSDGRGSPPSRGRPQERNIRVYNPWIVVQCAGTLSRRNDAIKRFDVALSSQLNRLTEDGATSMRQLRSKLLWTALLTFAATMLGGLALVGLGLSPLKRLSDAVSRISPTNFQLPLGKVPLPIELNPIADRLQHTLDQLRRAFDREKQAAADISHELRTPVAALLATLDVALRKPRPADEYRQALVEARSVGGQMRQLVERILAITRLDSGAARLQTTPVDIPDLVAQCVTLVRPLAAASNLTIKSDCPPALPWNTDPDKLREVLVNLLHNAIQYNRPGGSVILSVTEGIDRLEFGVRDTGIGISAEALPHVFERFYRADPSRQANELSAGLGLSIVQGYVNLMGGTIDVSSTPGEGTLFRISLPARDVDRGREAA